MAGAGGGGNASATTGSAAHSLSTTPAPNARRTPIPGLVTVHVESPADPNAETELYGEAIDSKTEIAPPNAPTPADPATTPAPSRLIDWRPLLVALVILQTAALIYVLFIR